MLALLYLEGLDGLMSSIHALCLNTFVLLFYRAPPVLQGSLSPKGRNLMETFLLRLSVPRPLMMHSVWLWVSVFVPTW